MPNDLLPCSTNHSLFDTKNRRFALRIFSDFGGFCMLACLQAYTSFGRPETTSCHTNSQSAYMYLFCGSSVLSQHKPTQCELSNIWSCLIVSALYSCTCIWNETIKMSFKQLCSALIWWHLHLHQSNCVPHCPSILCWQEVKGLVTFLDLDKRINTTLMFVCKHYRVMRNSKLSSV